MSPRAATAWAAIEADSRPVELACALFLLAAGLGCWWGDWLTLDNAGRHIATLAGAEPLAAMAATLVAGVQALAVLRRASLLRWLVAVGTSCGLVMVGAVLLADHGAATPAGPLCIVAAVVLAWASLAIASDMRGMRV